MCPLGRSTRANATNSQDRSFSKMGNIYYEVEVHVIHSQRLQRGINALFDAMMPGIVELSRHPNLAARDAGVLDSLADLVFIAIRQRGINVTISNLERHFDNMGDFVGLALPCPETNGWDLAATIEGEGFPTEWEIQISYVLACTDDVRVLISEVQVEEGARLTWWCP